MSNGIEKVWITPWGPTTDLATLSIGVPMDSHIRINDLKIEARKLHTITLGLLDDEDMEKLYHAIGKHLGIEK